MRIVQLADFDRPYTGSFIALLLGLCEEAQRRGHTCEAIFPSDAQDAPWLRDFEGRGIKATVAPFGIRPRRVSRGRWLRRHLGAADEPMLLHTHFTTWDIPAMLASRGRDARVVWHLHSTLSQGPWSTARQALKFLTFGRHTEAMLCPAPNIADAARRSGAPDTLVHFIPSALDVESFPIATPERRAAARQELGIDPEATVLLHFGWHWHLKGNDIFLETAAQLARDDDSVLAIDRGGGGRMIDYARRLGIEDRFRLISPVKDIQTLHAAADLLVSSSRDEGMAYALLESLSTGTPVVATSIPGHEFIGEHVDHMVMTGTDPAEIAMGTGQLLSRDPSVAADSALRAREWIVDNLSIGAIGSEIVDLYESTLDGAGRAEGASITGESPSEDEARKLVRPTAAAGGTKGGSLSTEPSFSVVIPAYNAPQMVCSTIDSVLAQTRKDLELIVVDDGSTDNTAEVVQRYVDRDPRVKLVRQENQGVAGARNTAISHAQAPLVSLLDNDDLWMPTYLDRMESVLDANPGAGFAYTDGWSLNEETHRIRKTSAMSRFGPPATAPPTAEALLAQLVPGNWILSSTTIRASVLAEVGGFDPQLNGVDDFDMWLRIGLAGHTAAYAEGRLIVQRDRADSQSRDGLMMYSALRETLQRVLDHPEATEAAQNSARKQISALDRFIAMLAGANAPARAAMRARRLASRVKHAVVPGPAYYETPPREVTAAFGDLSQV